MHSQTTLTLAEATFQLLASLLLLASWLYANAMKVKSLRMRLIVFGLYLANLLILSWNALRLVYPEWWPSLGW